MFNFGILIVEDDFIIVVDFEDCLIEMGYRIIGSICSGEVVLEFL